MIMQLANHNNIRRHFFLYRVIISYFKNFRQSYKNKKEALNGASFTQCKERFYISLNSHSKLSTLYLTWTKAWSTHIHSLSLAILLNSYKLNIRLPNLAWLSMWVTYLFAKLKSLLANWTLCHVNTPPCHSLLKTVANYIKFINAWQVNKWNILLYIIFNCCFPHFPGIFLMNYLHAQE